MVISNTKLNYANLQEYKILFESTQQIDAGSYHAERQAERRQGRQGARSPRCGAGRSPALGQSPRVCGWETKMNILNAFFKEVNTVNILYLKIGTNH